MTEVPSTASTSPQAAAHACRNCGVIATGTYCPNCGQETSLALPTVRSMLREAAGRYVALDGRIWRTLFPLLFRPGFLTREYFAGRRRRYIRPARLFLVLSIALFALLRLTGEPVIISTEELLRAAPADIAREIEDAGRKNDSNMGPALDLDLSPAPGSRLEPLQQRIDQFNRLSRRERGEQIFAGMLRYGPYAAFMLLPMFALLLKILYVGRARRYPLRPCRYAAHLVFGAHSHSFIFLTGIPLLLLPSGVLRIALIVWVIAYLLWSMKMVYGGRWSGVFARAFLIFIVYAIFFGFVIVGLVVAAVLLR